MSENKTILVVDDSDFDRNLLVRALAKKGGFTVLEANSGDGCMKVLSINSVDLILLDIVMPGDQGTQTLKQIRALHNPLQLPVVMITAKSDVADVVACLHMGANDYITKPVNFDIALSRVNTQLKLAEVSKEMARLQEVAALHAMVSTYNHEINNPLTIALGSLRKLNNNRDDDVAMKKAEEALWRVADIVKKIDEVTKKHQVQYQPYAGTGKMIKVG